jgi:FkbM family methyltransferase
MTISGRIGQFLPAKVASALRRYRASRRRSVSQIGQDFWVAAEVFNEMNGGYFVDVGAADGCTISNTYLLESRYNWIGICVEANPDFIERLKACRRAICVNACLDGDLRTVTFEKNGLFGGIVSSSTEKPPTAAEQVRMQTKTLLEVLDTALAPREIDYLSIDIEGAEERVLSSFDFGKYTFRCATIERPSPDLRQLLADNHYELVKNMPGLDAFYVHRSFLDQYVRNAMAFWSKRI